MISNDFLQEVTFLTCCLLLLIYMTSFIIIYFKVVQMPKSVFKPPYLVESNDGVSDDGQDILTVYPNHQRVYQLFTPVYVWNPDIKDVEVNVPCSYCYK